MKHLALFSIAALATATIAQEPTKEALKAKGWGKLYFNSHLGSFKCIDGSGRMEFQFAGTVLVTKIQGTVTATGNIKKEYEKNGRQVFSGRGNIVVDGKWRGVQWFGSDMVGSWYGSGAIRLIGEFDRNLQTGDYWYDGDPIKQAWNGSSMVTATLPKPIYGADTDVVPVERKKGG